MTTVVLLATAWGPKAGGINTFNMELARGLREVLGDPHRVICVVPSADPGATRSARECSVTLVSLDLDARMLADSFQLGWADRALSKLRKQGIIGFDLVIGHDVISGEAANAMRDEMEGARAVLLMHMSYSDYQGVKHGSGREAQEKEERQREVFERADVVLGVGPLLSGRARDIAGEPVTMIVPGLPAIEPRPSTSRLVALSFGRFEAKNDRIKQIRLAVEGVAAACQLGKGPGMPLLLKDNPLLKLIGVASDPKEERALREAAQKVAKQIVNLQALPYEEERSRLLRHIAEANLSLMLSWHEGFGLTGWESIAGEVPLIISEKTGLFQLLKETSLDGFVWPVVVEGSLGDPDDETVPNFTDDDRTRVAERIMEIAVDLNSALGRARTLKRALVDLGFTWTSAARTLLDAAKTSRPRPGAPFPQTPSGALRIDSAKPTGTAASVDDLLDTKEQVWPIERGLPPDSVLLRAEYQFVPFHELRRGLLDALADTWAENSEPALSIRLQIGAGGSGKTRLAIALASLLRDRGWRAGFLRDRADASQLAALFTEGKNTLVIIDYAETRRADLFALVRTALSFQKTGQRIRILLLARGAGDWWDRLPDGAPDKEVAATLASPRYTIGPYPLPTLVLENDQRARVYREARAAFAEQLNPKPPAASEAFLAAEHFAEPLFVHLAALCELRGQTLSEAHELLDAAIAREREYWKRAFNGVDLQGAGLDGAEQVVALATLVGGAPSTTEARRLVVGAPRLRGLTPVQHDRILDAVRSLYPFGSGLDALRPDLLGERLVHRSLVHDDGPLEAVFGETAGDRWIRSALTVLTRLARTGDQEARWLPYAFEGDRLERIALHALHVAAEAGDPLPHVLSEALASAPPKVQRTVIPRLKQALPRHSTALQEVAITVAKLWLDERIRAGSGKKAGIELLRAYDAFAMSLFRAGQIQQSRAPGEKALELARRFDDRTGVAMALDSFAATLGALGLYEEGLQYAREAVEVLREADSSKPTRNLANALANLAAFLGNLGSHDEAMQAGLEAENAWWKVSSRDSDSLLEWGRMHRLLVGFFVNVGRRADALRHARKAERILRELAAKQPDSYLPELAFALAGLARALDSVGQYRQAIGYACEAEELFSKLAAARPTAYQENWADTLFTVAHGLQSLGANVEALSRARSAQRIYESLQVGGTETLQSQLAYSLDTVAYMLMSTGEFDEASRERLRAVDLWREIMAKRPRAARDGLARSLVGAAEVASRLGHHENAIKQLEEANSIYAVLVAELPAAHESEAAACRIVLAEARLNSGYMEEAGSEVELAVAAMGKMEFPSTAAETRARGHLVIARVARFQGDGPRALAAARQAAQILREEQQTRPLAFVDVLRQAEKLCSELAQTSEAESAEAAKEPMPA